MNRGSVYYKLNQYEKAAEDFSKVIELNQNDTNAYRNRGDTYYQMGEYNKAIEDYSKAIEKTPYEAEFYNNRGFIYYFILEEYDKAIRDYNKAIELAPNNALYYSNRGNAYYKTKKYEEAIADYSKAIDLNPEDKEVYQNREKAKMELRDIQKVMVDKLQYTILVSLFPIAAVIFKIKKDERAKARKKFRFVPIQAWKAYGVIIIFSIMFFWSGFFSLFTGLSILSGAKSESIAIMAENLVVTLGSFAICLSTLRILGGLFNKKELSKNLLFFNIAFSLSLILFIRLNSGFSAALVGLSAPVIIPSLASLYVVNKHGQILIVKGSEIRMNTTPIFPAELTESYSDPEYLGGGGFAWVFQAKRKDREKVAIKIPAIKDEKTGKLFISEVANWNTLDHKNIVRLNSFNIYPHPYLEMELCDGSLETGRREIGEAAWIVHEIANGLKHAHERNIVHGDIKHANILVKDGKLKISDWGLSKVKRGKSFSVAGITPEFAAPEQFIGKADERTDIWQLGGGVLRACYREISV